ncbi:MAG TPA: sulfite oxidase [Acidimicrobiia bacterium]|nr:sulfite oxidase [Acidimicrobiia bacterium]
MDENQAVTTPTQEANSPHEPTEGPLLLEELHLAFRNRGMPLEAMAYDLTPSGLHYLVVHWDVPQIDPTGWRLRIGGRVEKPYELTLEEIRALPQKTMPVTLECAGNGRGWLLPRPVSLPWLGEAIGTAEWTGTPLSELLQRAGVDWESTEVVFWGADRGIQGEEEQTYGRSLSLEEALRPEVMVAYEMNGQPLQPQHGFPLRLLVPGWYGMTSVKWLTEIEVVTEPFAGFQQVASYRYQTNADDPGEPVQRIRVRALMVPPGIPDFFSRHRFVEKGTVKLAGRAWSGQAPITKVEVGVDGQWSEATLGSSMGDYAWRGWSFLWNAEPGDHELACRASDGAGNIQPLEAPWNYQGMGNNVVQRLVVTVR